MSGSIAQAVATEVIELLKSLVRFPSLSHQEAEIADFVEHYVRQAGLPVRRMDNNVYFWLGEGEDRLLLNSHLDVVPPSADHPFDPFEPVEVDGKLYGRGTVDAKASGAAMTTALLSLAREGWRPPNGQVIVALTACEETGGGYNGLEALRPHLPPLQAAIVGEPTCLQPCVAQKGLLILKLHARGRTAHAARPHLGDNAILRAARDIQRLSRFRFDRADPFLGAPTLTVTTIQGGTAHNVVPEHCTFTLDIRTTPAYTHAEIVQLLAGVVESEIEVHSDRFIPVATPVDARIVQACLRANPGSRPFGSPTASDWIFLHDIPTVKLGPGPSERSHTGGEHIELDELVRAVRVYRDIIRHYYALGEESRA
ncbi:M20 family metallo-hydrolase [Rhodothermus marinus]|uniref:Peptidase M20 n=1 Tax=Rhodothermus marinus (strain ATCC 43812 / DSM 4252 / R-10) TaxID=518766 RepID=D0MJ50_RHOM4|nr:M20 family metallo-hydrolase [Rhodothermus marinus]ACY48508.1 peptidase M20 [Rhodothermus marinus DSM 4252]AEN73109.1 peptidase M20 [Rhodothermus marinus SG0.5JP17-172]MBO2492899.1 M20/M25/M40 family metallo-hydrolase [Rhodothermus marinus]